MLTFLYYICIFVLSVFAVCINFYGAISILPRLQFTTASGDFDMLDQVDESAKDIISK